MQCKESETAVSGRESWLETIELKHIITSVRTHLACTCCHKQCERWGEELHTNTNAVRWYSQNIFLIHYGQSVSFVSTTKTVVLIELNKILFCFWFFVLNFSFCLFYTPLFESEWVHCKWNVFSKTQCAFESRAKWFQRIARLDLEFLIANGANEQSEREKALWFGPNVCCWPIFSLSIEAVVSSHSSCGYYGKQSVQAQIW